MLRTIFVHGASLEGAIIATIAYSDIFSFAPKAEEIHRYLICHRASRAEVEEALQSSALRSLLSCREGYWFFKGKDHLAPRRKRFSMHSAHLWPKARQMAKLVERSGIASCGMITGSLAADNADEHADIDFLFIYPGARTWTSFAAMRMIAKVPLLGMETLCPNYVLAEDRLTVKPQNLFTAWEIAKAVPMFGYDVFERFLRSNDWAQRYLPNAFHLLERPAQGSGGPSDPSWARALTENSAFHKLESWERQRKFKTDKRDAGVDMKERERKGSMDRHSPTRSFHTLSEWRYRMQSLGLVDHPVFEEVRAATNMLEDEMGEWGGEPIEKRVLSAAGQG